MAPRQCPEWVAVTSHDGPDAQPAFYIRGGKRRVSKTEPEFMILDPSTIPPSPPKRSRSDYAASFVIIREAGSDESAPISVHARPGPAPLHPALAASRVPHHPHSAPHSSHRVPRGPPSMGPINVGPSIHHRNSERSHSLGSAAPAMERTASGLSIESSNSNYNSPSQARQPYSPQQQQQQQQYPRERPAEMDYNLLTDHQALELVRRRMEYMQDLVSNRPDSPEARHEFLLHSIIDPRLGDKGWDIDDAALTSILIATNHLFFDGRLQGRVKWDWSHPDSDQYERSIIGTTALRRRAAQVVPSPPPADISGGGGGRGVPNWAGNGQDQFFTDTAAGVAGAIEGYGRARINNTYNSNNGHGSSGGVGGVHRSSTIHADPRYDGFETLIILSQPILRSRDYSRNLLISTFLHELIHCFLFVCCGFEARREGGHTYAFREIAKAIDVWAGVGVLHLGEMEADLSRFRKVVSDSNGGIDGAGNSNNRFNGANAMGNTASDAGSYFSSPSGLFDSGMGAGGVGNGMVNSQTASRPVFYVRTRSEVEAVEEWRPRHDEQVRPRQGGLARDAVWDHCVHDAWDGCRHGREMPPYGEVWA